MSPKPGRPRTYGRAALAVTLQVRALRSEKIAWRKAARRAGKSLSEWLRAAANKAAAGD